MALPSVFATEMVKVTVPPAATNDGLTVFEIDGPAAPHALIIRAVSAPVAFGKLLGRAAGEGVDGGLRGELAPRDVARRVGGPDGEQVLALRAARWSSRSPSTCRPDRAAAVPAAAIVQALPPSLATPSALVSA